MTVPSLCAAAGAGLALALALPASTGVLRQLPGRAGCVSSSPFAPGCTQVRALSRASVVLVSPDGKHVYVAGGVGSLSQLATLRRGAGGALVQADRRSACFLARGYGGGGPRSKCSGWRAMETPSALAFSPDGRYLYVAAPSSWGVDVFRRDPSGGGLVQAGCVSSGAAAYCRRVPGLQDTRGVAVSPDGRHLYVAVPSGVQLFARNAATGLLAPVEHVAVEHGAEFPNAVAVAPDGRHVYMAGTRGLTVFGRDPATGRLSQPAGPSGCFTQSSPRADPECTPAAALQESRSLALSPDGRNLYVASQSSNGVAVFARDTATGTLRQVGCVNAVGSAGCTKGRALVRPSSVAISSDGRSVYVASVGRQGGVAVFRRDEATGALTQVATIRLRAVPAPSAIAVAPDGRNVYVAGGALAVLRREP